MSQFFPLKVKEIRPETREAVSIVFDVPADLQDTFKFTQGQYLVLRTQVQGEEVRRSYSICSTPGEGEIRVAVKRVPNGLFSSFANDRLEVGQTLEAMPPEGRFFTPLDSGRQGNYLMVAAGSGITPVISLIKTTLKTEPNSKVTLIYGNRSSNSTMFREELEDLKNTYMKRLNLIFVFSREQQDLDLYNGRIDLDKCNRFFERWIDVKNLDAAFICGPQAMTEMIRSALEQHGVAADRIHFELFGAQGSSEKQAQRAEMAAQDQSVSHVTVIHDGHSMAFDLQRNTSSILNAGNEQGADLPFSCKAGVCSTCRAKLVEGEVEMDNNFALEDYEIAAGYVLSCQCYPISDKIVLDYDQ